MENKADYEKMTSTHMLSPQLEHHKNRPWPIFFKFYTQTHLCTNTDSLPLLTPRDAEGSIFREEQKIKHAP